MAFWNKNRVPPIQTGILFKYTFDGVQMNEEVKAGTLMESHMHLGTLTRNPDHARYLIQQKYHLSSMPNIVLTKNLNYMRDNVRIIAEVSCKHTTRCAPQRMNPIQVLFAVLGTWSVAGLILFLIFMSALTNKQSEEPDCIVWFDRDIPYKLVVDTSEYPLNRDGSMSKYTRAFLNPWQQQVVDSGQCIRRSK